MKQGIPQTIPNSVITKFPSCILITIKLKRETMNKTMNRYKEYETRSVNPQECVHI